MGSCRGVVGSADAHVQSIATRRPRPQAVRARGASLLPFRLPARPSLGSPWAWGLLSAFWQRGSPDLPACGLRRGSSGGPARPIFISSSSRPSRGAKPRRADDMKLPQRQPHQAGSRGGGEIKAGVPREEPVTQAMTIETRRAPGGRRPAQCPCFPLVQRGQAQAGASGKGFHSGATRPRLEERRDGGHRGAQDGVITSAFGSRRPTLVRITCTRCSPSKWPLLVPFPLNIWEEDQASINRTSHHSRRQLI